MNLNLSLIHIFKEPKIHPQLAFQHSGMFSDSESAYTMSMKYYKEQQMKSEALTQTQNTTKGNDLKDDTNV